MSAAADDNPRSRTRRDGTSWHDPSPAGGRGRPYGVKGMTTTLKGGARSPRVYGALAEHLTEGLLADRPDLAAYPEAVAGWATAEAQATLMRRYIDERGSIDEETGEPRHGIIKQLDRFEKLAARHRTTLGLDPRSEAALARERAEATTLNVDLSALVERGRAALETRREHGEEDPPDLAGQILSRVRAEGEAAMAEAEAKRDAAEAAQDITAGPGRPGGDTAADTAAETTTEE